MEVVSLNNDSSKKRIISLPLRKISVRKTHNGSISITDLLDHQKDDPIITITSPREPKPTIKVSHLIDRPIRRRSVSDVPPRRIEKPDPTQRRNSSTDVDIYTLDKNKGNTPHNNLYVSLVKLCESKCANLCVDFSSKPIHMLSERLTNEDHSDKPLLQLPYIMSLSKLEIGSLGHYIEVLPGRALRETRIITGIGLYLGNLCLRVNTVVCIDSILAYFSAENIKIVYDEEFNQWFILTHKHNWIPGVEFYPCMTPIFRTYIVNTDIVETEGKIPR